MNQDIGQRLATALEKVRRKAKLKAKIQSAYRQFDEASEELKKCTAILAKEHADVLSLEGLSLTGIFHSLIGNREQKLAIEQQEYIAAKLKHDAARESAQQLKLELTRLESELSLMDEVEREYGQLISEKESYLSASQTQAACELVEIGQRLSDLDSDRRELSEAIQAGEQALSRLETVRSSLSSATSWGMADMFGGGMLTTMVKHSAMDRAKEQAHEAHQAILHFQQELADTGHNLQASIQIDGFSRFADIFFDGIIMDWMMQSKIQSASTACSETIAKVQLAVRRCDNCLASVRREHQELTEERVRLIEATDLTS